MSGDDVHRNEMEIPFDFSNEAAEALLSGRGAGVDPSVAGLLDELRSTYRPSEPPVGHELSTFFQEPAVSGFGRSRVGFAAKVGAAVAAVLAATGGLAVAGALPGPVQNALSHVAADFGVHVPGDDHPTAPLLVESPAGTTSTTDVPTTVAPPETTTVVPERHGLVVSGVAHNATNHGCEHGRAVSAVASQGKAQTKPCHPHSTTTTTTLPPGVTTTTQPPRGHSGDHHHDGPPPSAPSGHTTGSTSPDHGATGHAGS
jgi:hypothetical protein